MEQRWIDTFHDFQTETVGVWKTYKNIEFFLVYVFTYYRKAQYIHKILLLVAMNKFFSDKTRSKNRSEDVLNISLGLLNTILNQTVYISYAI